MLRNYGNDPWDNDDEYDPRPGSSRPPNPDRGGRPPSDYDNCSGGAPPPRSSRPSQPIQGGYEDWIDDPLGYGRSRGGPTNRRPAWMDNFDKGPLSSSRAQAFQPSSRARQAPPPRGPQGSRAQPPRYNEQDYGDDDEGDEHDDPSMQWSSTTGRHAAIEDHVVGRCGESEGWFDSRHAAEAARQCAVQCGGYPRDSCQVRPATHPQADPGSWALQFPTMARKERSMGGGGRRGDEHYGGDERQGRGGCGGGRPSDGGGGGGGGYWYS